MASGLIHIDVAGASRRNPGPWAQAGVAVAAIGVSVVIRALIEMVLPGVVPFALLYPAVLAATLLAGWRSGLGATVLGGGLAAYFLLEPRHSFEVRTAADIISLLLYVVTAIAIVLLAEAFRVQAAGRAADASRGRAALAETAGRLQLAMDAGHMGVWHVVDGKLAADPKLNVLLGFPVDSTPSLTDVRAGYDPQELQRVRAEGRAAVARGDRFFEAEQRYRRPDGSTRWLLSRAEMLLTPGGAVRGAIGVLIDITARRDAEERVRLLAREVDHRANNLLAVVQGAVSLSQAPDVASLKTVLIGRISALARAHQLLSQARWEGADLRRLVEEELLAFSLGDAARVSIRGETALLGPAAAQAVAMALHELATNAAKYGALSTAQGRVDVAWTWPDRQPLLIRWVESGGPPVAAPTRRGLGTVMLERALAGGLKGATRLDWRPEGLVCELELPHEAAVSRAASTG